MADPAALRFDHPVHVTRPILPNLDDYVALLGDAWASGQLTNNGPLLHRLRGRLSAHLDAPHIAVVANGTLALQVALAALGVKGEVITPAFTFPAAPHALTWAGITPVFVDIDPVRLTLDPRRVEEAITDRTTCILAVHVYGIPCHLEALADIARRHGLRLIYDGAHAFDTKVDGIPIGAFGDATTLSFHATKLFHSAEGGALILRDEAVLRRVEWLQNFGMAEGAAVMAPGINAKMSELGAALGLLVLDRVEQEHRARTLIAGVYRTLFADARGIRMLEMPEGVTDSHQYAVLLVDEAEAGLSRDGLCERLAAFNIFARRYFYPLCSEAPHYRHLPSAAPANLPVSVRVSHQVLCLPFYGALGREGAARVAGAVRHILAH